MYRILKFLGFTKCFICNKWEHRLNMRGKEFINNLKDITNSKARICKNCDELLKERKENE